jgi:hypothetical protein
MTKIRHSTGHPQLTRTLVFGALLIVSSLLLSFGANALTSISQGFATSDKLSLGSIVSLQGSSPDHVVGATTSNADSILGVVINNDTSLLSLSNGQEDQVQIATSGIVSVLVSDINGAIVQNDQITASPIKGVGMKATSNAKVIGIAQSKPTNSTTTKQNYTDEQGDERTITLGEVPVMVNASYFFKTPEKTLIPSAIQNLANALAGKSVSALPIIISGAIFIVTLIVVVSIVYSMIRSSIISVGRNPMSQSAIYRDIIQLSALVLGILAVGLISIYVILTRF